MKTMAPKRKPRRLPTPGGGWAIANVARITVTTSWPSMQPGSVQGET